MSVNQPEVWADTDRRVRTALRASSYEAVVEAARADEREKVAQRLVSWAGSLDGDGAAVALEAADVVRECR
jgi:hypothetical protein